MPRNRGIDTTVRGSTGLPVWGGRVYDEFLPELQGDRGRKVLREMSEQDPIVGGIMLGVELLSRQVTWSVLPAEVGDSQRKKKKADEVAEFVDGCLTDMNPGWGNTLSEILSMLSYGWSWLEILYKRRQGLHPDQPLKHSRFDDSKIGWRGWAIRSQETLDTWEFEHPNGSPENGGVGELTGMWQVAPPTYQRVLIPRSKSLHFTTRSRRQNPEGISVLRNAYRAWYMKKHIEIIEGVGIERDLAGLPILWAPQELFSEGADADQKSLFSHLQEIVTSIKRDEQEGIIMPMAFDDDGKNPLYKLELLSTGGDRQFDTSKIISRYDERIAMSMLADFILMGHESVGSYALSTTKTGLFSNALSAWLDLIADEVNMAAIPQLVQLNGWDLEFAPSLAHGKIEAADLTKVGEYLKSLNAAGMTIFPNPVLEAYVLETAGLPSTVDQDELNAGKFPVPGIGPDGQPLPSVGPDGKLLPVQPQLPAGAGGQPPAGNRPPAPAVRPVRQPTGASQRAAAERARPKHFVSLSQRVHKLRKYFEASMEPDDYKEFLSEVMAAGQFGKLGLEYQESILAAEAEQA